MGLVPKGGYVVVTGDQPFVVQRDFSDEQLNQLADLLGMHKDKPFRDRLVPDIKSIHIYRRRPLHNP